MKNFKLFSPIEREKIKDLFINSGYVLDFTNESFKNFVLHSINIDVYSDDFKNQNTYGSDSKGHLFMTLIDVESDDKVLKLIHDLLDYYQDVYGENKNIKLFDECNEIINKKLGNYEPKLLSLEDCDNFLILLKEEINSSIERDRYISALDRLHTFFIRYLRLICEKNNITLNDNENKRLDTIYKKYIKSKNFESHLTSSLSKSMIKSLMMQIQNLGKFNNVRNNESMAHDNELLNEYESKYIVNSILCLIEFIQDIEEDM